MDADTVIVIAALPFYVMGIAGAMYTLSYAVDKAKRLNDSAQEQQITEQTETKVK
jgi:hypothetical protein